MKNDTYKGGCLCGQIRFEIIGKIQDIVYCHCSQCRKAQGSVFATNGNVDVDDFIFVLGESELTGYESSPGQIKYFCKHCGSPIISKNQNSAEKIRVRLGAIESEITERPSAHIFIASKANWENFEDNVPHYETYEPNRL
ncbi:hypothetical protein MNBD_GAMMA05-1107 [hydrothermal vent metagenome]|uniref:CENP-V/GFA domain-containing protein n=1 Tax=hydrothermal vent metagenome TaxID=652676 RepID=A0A3B0W9B2_9ZZZZ